MTRIGIVLLWLIHWLPLPLQAMIGRSIGHLLYFLIAERRRVTLTNLQMCFPLMSAQERQVLAREHLALVGRSIVERGLAWWASEARLRRLISIEGLHNLEEGKPTILMTPHFVALDMGWTGLTLERPMLSMYARQKSPAFNQQLLNSRLRFGSPMLLSRQEGIRPTVKAIKGGRLFYYLPDMDYGPNDAIFVPFFGVPAATITGLARIAQLTGANVHDCITEMLPNGRGYVTRIGPAWEGYPSGDIEADTRRMNAAIEAWVDKMPAQYYWVHKRFKTRPPGEPRPY